MILWYQLLSFVEYMGTAECCKNNDYEVVDTKYEENAKIYVAVRDELASSFEQQMMDLSNREARITIVQNEFYA